MEFLDFLKGKYVTVQGKTGTFKRYDPRSKKEKAKFSVGQKVRISSTAGSRGRGVIGKIKELGEKTAKIIDQLGRLFEIPHAQLEMVKSKHLVQFLDFFKGCGDKHKSEKDKKKKKAPKGYHYMPDGKLMSDSKM